MLYLANLFFPADAIVEGSEHLRPGSIVTILKIRNINHSYRCGTKITVASPLNYQPLTKDNIPTFLTDEDILELL